MFTTLLTFPLVAVLSSCSIVFPSTMTSQQHQSNKKGVSAENIVSLPSLSCALSSLPQATNMSNVSLHQNMYAKRAADSQAKVCVLSYDAPGFLAWLFIAPKSPLKNSSIVFSNTTITGADASIHEPSAYWSSSLSLCTYRRHFTVAASGHAFAWLATAINDAKTC